MDGTALETPRRRQRLPSGRSLAGWLGLLTLILLVLYGVSTFTYRRGLEELSREGSIRLQLFVTYLRGVLEKYESLPELLARDETLVNYLLNPGGRENTEALNRYLETVNRISKSSDTYLMDKEGLTIAASNWQSERPFVGSNFSYRPYFQQAMQGDLGRYFALGTTSLKRGYFFAYPVRIDKEVLGAVVIKINIDDVERRWGNHDQTFMVTDPDKVIFITTRPDWRFKTLGQVVIGVEDRGPGISEEDLGRIFDPFYTTKKSGEGLGLGLTITERVLKEMGATIRVESKAGRTRFEVSLATAEEEHEHAQQSHLHR